MLSESCDPLCGHMSLGLGGDIWGGNGGDSNDGKSAGLKKGGIGAAGRNQMGWNGIRIKNLLVEEIGKWFHHNTKLVKVVWTTFLFGAFVFWLVYVIYGALVLT